MDVNNTNRSHDDTWCETNKRGGAGYGMVA